MGICQLSKQEVAEKYNEVLLIRQSVPKVRNDGKGDFFAKNIISDLEVELGSTSDVCRTGCFSGFEKKFGVLVSRCDCMRMG